MNPVNEEAVPVWVADYVLGSYGSGAIMAVPAHDTRDFDFAHKFALPVRQVVQSPSQEQDLPYTGQSSRSHHCIAVVKPCCKPFVTEQLMTTDLGSRQAAS